MDAGSAREALQQFRSQDDFDLIITDQAMPGMTGSDLIAAVRKERPTMPVILATGYGETPIDNNATVRRLGKPFNQSDLRRVIRDAVAPE